MKNLKIKIAIISTRKPSLTSGAEVRNYYLSQGLKKDFDVKTYVPSFRNIPFTHGNGDVKLTHKIKFLLSGKIPFVEKLKRGQFEKIALNEIKNADIVQIQELETYFTFERYLNELKGKLVLDTHNIAYKQFLAETESKNIIEKYLGRLLARSLKHIELEAIKKFDHILVCSRPEKDFFSHYVNSQKITILPNGANFERTASSTKINTNDILFMGLLGYQPNAEGLKYYINNVHPKVLQKVPDARLIILGKDAPIWLREATKNDSTIKIEGFVKDVQPYIQKAKVCICPILSGSGTRLKVLEYMAMRKPVVSTTIGAEGILIKDKHNILLADSPEAFSENVVTMLLDKKLAERIGENGRKTIEKDYSWNKISASLANLYKQL